MPVCPTDLLAVTCWITGFVLGHPTRLPLHLSNHLGITRRRANALVRALVDAQWVAEDGPPGQRLYRPGLLRQTVHTYPLAGLQQDLLWARDVLPHCAVRPNVARLLHHAFTELLDNAVEHSGATQVTVSVRQTPSHVQLLVSDDGCGAFAHIGQSLGIDGPALAAFELAKGKLSSAPQRHTGRGLFFTARAADVFELQANATAFRYRGDDGCRPVAEAPARRGTTVFVGIALDTDKSLDGVLRAASADGAGHGFDRTVLPLRLLADGQTGLESRAQARRALHRAQLFKQVSVDFDGLDDVGHGFADELLRVWPQQWPHVVLTPRNMAPRVASLVASVQAGD